MTEGEPNTRTPFAVVSGIKNIHGRDYYVQRVQAISEALDGFDVSTVSKEVVATIVSHTINGMIDHGASALGLDLDSMFGRVHASGHLRAAMGVGVLILDEVAPRSDDATWDGWIRAEFPQAVSQLYGSDSTAAQLALNEMR